MSIEDAPGKAQAAPWHRYGRKAQCVLFPLANFLSFAVTPVFGGKAKNARRGSYPPGVGEGIAFTS